MGRYVGKITHTYSTNPNRPTFEETIQMARVICVKAYLEKLTPQQQEEFIRIGKELGLLT